MQTLDLLFDALRREVSGRSAWAYADTVHHGDRLGTHAAFNATSEGLAETMRDLGLADVRLVKYPADGRTLLGDWLPSPAWDATFGELEVLEPADLAGVYQRYPDTNTALAMCSEPTPPGGLLAELVDAELPAAGRNLRGKVALISKRPGLDRTGLIARGVAAIVSDTLYSPQRRLGSPDAVAWENVWHERWDDPRCPVMLIDGRQGTALRAALAAGRSVRVRLTCRARNYSGHLLTATGVIPGRRRDQEIVGIAHCSEIGANDNASGVGGLLESARAILKLIKRKGLRLARSIRLIFPFECYGTAAWLTRTDPRRRARIIGGVNPDMIGYNLSATRATMTVRVAPDSSPGPANALLLEICRRLARLDGSYRWEEGGPAVNDRTFLCDPHVGQGVAGLGQGMGDWPDSVYHSSLDTMAQVDPHYLGLNAVALATQLATLAGADAQTAAELAAETFFHFRRRLDGLLREPAPTGGLLPAIRLRALADVGAEHIASAEAYFAGAGRPVAAKAIEALIADWRGDCQAAATRMGWSAPADPTTPPAARRVPVRREPYFPAGDRLTPRQRRRFSEQAGASFPWSDWLAEALFLTDGRRDIAQIHRRLALRYDVQLDRLTKAFKVMHECDYVRLGQGGTTSRS